MQERTHQAKKVTVIFEKKRSRTNRRLAFSTFTFKQDFALCDERQLSSDLDNALKLNISEQYETSGQDESIQPKRETRDNCMFGGQIKFPQTSPLGMYNPSQQFPGEIQTGFIKKATFHPESHQPQWHSDLEMDNAPSMISMPKAPPQYQYKPAFPDILSPKGNETYFDNPVWSPEQYQGQGYPECRGETFVANGDDIAMETDMKYCGLSYHQDELGDCPLHTLSEVTDKTVMANVLESVQNSNSLPRFLNLQNKQKQTPLFLAVYTFNIPLIGWLLDHGADPNIQGTLSTGRHDYVWRAPLHLVAMKGDNALIVLQMMHEKCRNLNPNIQGIADKLTPLHIALKNHILPSRSCKLLVKELIRYGADVGIREQASSKTPLLLAIETRDLDLMREYLELFSADRRRALLQDKTRAGDTCLHIAAGLSRFPSQDKEVLLRMLVMHGANGNTANNAKELPRDFARTEWDRVRS